MKETQYSKTRKKILTLIDQLKKDSILLLPTEKQLVEQLDVGRNTIRNVISDIVDNGLLERIPGK